MILYFASPILKIHEHDHQSNSHFLGTSVNEFIQIWALGGSASLNLSTNNGLTTVAFNCTIGHPGAPHSLHPSSAPFPTPTSPSHPPRHRGQAERERNRVRAARHQAAQAKATAQVPATNLVVSASSTDSVAPASPTDSVVTASPADSVAPASPTDSVTPAPLTDSVTPAPLTDSVILSSVTAAPVMAHVPEESEPLESSLAFKCDQCTFTSLSDKGLKTHIRMKHRLSQLDGHESDSESDDSNSIPEIKREVIDKECFEDFGTAKKCEASCNEIFTSKEDCYRHMFLSNSQCCQTLISNLNKSGFEDTIKKVGLQRVVLKVKKALSRL